MEQVQAFMSSRLLQIHLDYMVKLYDVPKLAVACMSDRIRDEGPTEEGKASLQEWRDSMASIFGNDLSRLAYRQIEACIDELHDAREELRKVDEKSFDRIVHDHLRRAKSYATELAWSNEGRKFDISIDMDFCKAGEVRPRIEFDNIVYRRSTPTQGVTFYLRPSFRKKVPKHLGVLTTGKDKLFVLDMDRIEDHVFEDDGIHVFRAMVFGPDKEGMLTTFNQYVLEHQNMCTSGDSTPMFAHGSSVAKAKALLDRRVKRETLSQLGF